MGVLGDSFVGAQPAYDVPFSLAFDGVNDYLRRTESVGSNRQVMTCSLWSKHTDFARVANLISWQSGGSYTQLVFINDQVQLQDTANGTAFTSVVLGSSTSAWYHWVFHFDTTQGLSSNRARFWRNNAEFSSGLGNLVTDTRPGNGTLSVANVGTNIVQLGAIQTPGQFFAGNIAEVHFVDGLALPPSSFGELRGGLWKPKEYTGSHGTNGFYLPFDDATSTTTLGYDDAGSNDFTLNNMTTAAQSTDSPSD